MSADNKSEEEKRDRQMLELLNELRVALPGVQMLFAFLLVVPFQQRFQDVTSFQRNVYYATMLSAAIATVFLIAPSAAHRVRFHQSDRAWLIETASRLMIVGLFFLGLAMSGTVLLITDVIWEGAKVWAFPSLIAVLLFGTWFARPLARGDESSGP